MPKPRKIPEKPPALSVKPQALPTTEPEKLPVRELTPEQKAARKSFSEEATRRLSRCPSLKVKPAEEAPYRLSLSVDGPPGLYAQTHALFGATGCVQSQAAVSLLDSLERLIPFEWSAENRANRFEQELAILHELEPKNALEGMLCAQMLATHKMAMTFSGRALLPDQTTEGVEMNISRVTKLMRTFTAQVEALNRLRNAGKQTVVVQHVNVSDGGQAAIVGATMPGGGAQ